MELKSVHVTYCSNYNGCYFSAVTQEGKEIDLDGHPEFGAKEEVCRTTIVDQAVDDCDDDGEYHGDIEELEAFCVQTIKDAFGAHVVVTFEEDDIST